MQLPMKKFGGGYKSKVKERKTIRERLAIKKKVRREMYVEIYPGTYLQSPMGYSYARTRKLQFCVGDLDLPERRKEVFQ